MRREAFEHTIRAAGAVLDDPDGTAADTIDGSIGEASMFHSTAEGS